MKILHTSDWHIGKQLHKVDLADDLEFFFNWLVQTIKEKEIDLLLVSGDVFDQANPSQAALTQYYGFLKRMIGSGCNILITGGNHDSAAVLNAPKDILSILDVHVVGGATDNIEDLFFTYHSHEHKVVVAGVPFLKDKDIRKSVAGESYDDKIEQIRAGIKTYFSNINHYYSEHYSDHCYIVMGHLYAQGAKVSESMRDIQIGNQAGINETVFGDLPHYVALGHIHKPYAVSEARRIHYSGSPVALSFSEKEEVKQVNILSIEGKEVTVDHHPVPQFRNLVAFEGTLAEVKAQLNNYAIQTPLKSLAELIISEPNESIHIRQELDDLLETFQNDYLHIIKSRLNFVNKIRGASDGFKPGVSVADVTPMEMFEKRLELDGIQDNRDELTNAFRQILEELNL